MMSASPVHQVTQRPAETLRFAALRTAALGAVALASACSDPSFHLQFDVPAGYRDQVQQISVDVVVPPAGTPFSCDDIAFREVDDAQISAATIFDERIRDGDGTSITGIPRQGTKLFRLLGLDSDGSPVVAACGSIDDVNEDIELALTGEPTATGVLVMPDPDPGDPLRDFEMRIVDISGERLVGIETRWTVTGPKDEYSTGSATTSALGVASIRPEAPALPGPIAVDVRPRWVQTALPSVLAFQNPPAIMMATLPSNGAPDDTANPDLQYVVGRVGPEGQMGLAALGPTRDPIGIGRSIYIAYYDASQSPPFRSATSSIVRGVFALGLVSEGPRDQVFAMNGVNWIEVQPDGNLTLNATPAPGRTAIQIRPVGSCDSPSDVALLEVVDAEETTTVLTVGADGVAVANAFEAPLDSPPNNGDAAHPLASGCVATTDGQVHRVVVYRLAANRQLLVADVDGLRRTDLNAVGIGIGFADAVDGDGPYLLATQIAVSGAELGRYRLVPLGSRGLDLEIVTRDSTPTLALSSAGGDFDGDKEIDVAAVVVVGEGDRTTDYRILVGLEVDHRDGRLIGMSAKATSARPRLRAADFDGDGIDEMLLATPTAFSILRMAP